MAPEHLRFGGGAADTAIHPAVLVYMLVAVLLILVLPRGKAIVPFLLAFFTIPIGQVLVLGGFHFTVLRILILAGLARMAVSGKSGSVDRFPGGFNRVDQVAALWAVSAVIMFNLQYLNKDALVQSLGDTIDTLGAYMVVRFLIPDGEAVRRTIKTLAAVCLINGICMINEKISHVNVFGLLGGISAEVTVRDDKIRAAGVMGALYAGAFAGVLIPLFLWLWTGAKSRVAAVAGLFGAIAMVITSTSSTSYMALGGSLLGLAFWPLRKNMRLVRWAFASLLIALHLVMKAPVWALISRIDLTGSSSGDERFMLLDTCIRHFGDWWLIGSKYYTSWGWDMWDLVNQFVAVATTGGLLTLIFYIAIFKRSFAAIGDTRKLGILDEGQEWFQWCMGSVLFATVVASFGINYVSQLLTGFFCLLGCISITIFEARQAVPKEVEASGDFRRTPLQRQSKLRQQPLTGALLRKGQQL